MQTLTIVKTDIKGFTKKSATITSVELNNLLESHKDITERIAKSYDGIVFKEIGDSFLIAFKSATNAIQMAISLQRAFTVQQVGKHEWKIR